MKALIKITAFVLVGVLSFSCDSWLDVDPKTEVKSDKMFESEQGFKDAMIGCYLKMTSTSLYGRELTAGFLEAVAQQFTISSISSSDYYYISRFDYNSALVILSNIWVGAYEAVANVNNILENIDGKTDILHPTHYNIIKGEALGLRAFLHFDLLRLFGWGDMANNPDILKKMSIPYQFRYNKQYPDQYTVEKVLEYIIADLEAASDYLENYDPWSTVNKSSDYYLPNEDKFYTNRMTRFNYWAARATLARVYMWTGEYGKALPILQDFIDNSTVINADFRWIRDTEINAANEVNRDLTFSMEHIFRLDVNKLADNISMMYDPEYNKPNTNNHLFYHTPAYANTLYEIPLGASDYRYTRLYQTGSDRYSLRKFNDFDNYLFPNRMPLIRMSEMYYMAAECLNRAGRLDEAVKLLDIVRANRGIAPQDMLAQDETMTRERLTEEIEKEWKKEFLGEGQMFYFYKRLNSAKMANVVIADPEDVYVMPMPEDEIQNGGRETNKPEEEE